LQDAGPTHGTGTGDIISSPDNPLALMHRRGGGKPCQQA